MSQTGREKIASINTKSALQECRGIAARRLPAGVYEVLRQVKADLIELAPSTQKYELFALYREALDITQGRWSIIESRFRTHFLNRYDQACQHSQVQLNNATPTPDSDFKLMDSDDLEESLAANTLSNAIKSICIQELMGLNPRMGTLLKDPEFQRGLNPLGPEIIGSALMDTIQELEGSIKAKLVLIPMFNKYFPSRVQSVYQEINTHLLNKGVLPTIHVGSRKAPPDQGVARDQAKESRPESNVRTQDMFAMLQKLMSLGRIGGSSKTEQDEDQARSMSAPLPERKGTASVGLKGPELPERAGLLNEGTIASAVRSEDPPMIFLTRLTQWQQGEADAETVEEFGFPNFDGRTNVLHAIRKSQSVRDLGQVNSLTLDIVALLFDFILDDRRIPDAMKAIIGRLQIPVLKVAMLDPSIFSNKSHPARELLDTLAKAAMGWNAEEGHESPLYQKMESLVQRINSEFIEDTKPIVDAVEELKAFLTQEKTSANQQMAKAVQVVHSREQLAEPKLMAHDEVARRLESQAMPKLVRQFLIDHWEPLLTKVFETQGPESETWIKAISTMDDLVWSVAPKNTSDERKKLLVILPKMLKWLEQGLQFLGTSGQQRDPFFAELVKYHTEAVRPGLDDAEFATSFDIAVVRPSEFKPVTEEPEEFEALTAPLENIEPTPALLEEIAQESDEPEEILIGDVRWASDEPYQEHPNKAAANSSDYDTLVKNLKRGTWIEIDQEDGECLRAKLAWVSPLRGIYLFTNRLGQQAISINAHGLAGKFRDGRVRLIDNVPLMDRAVSGLLDRLQHNYP